jgi:hypothetical protein
MPTIKVDNKEYDVDSLSIEAKAQLGGIQFVDNEIAMLRAQTTAIQAARNTYVKTLASLLPGLEMGDAIELS